MAITKEKKKEVIKKVQNALVGAQSVVFVNFHGLSVQDANAMRKDLRTNKVGYFVAKKSLIRLALTDTKISGTVPELSGEIALAYGEDSLVPARTIQTFVKKYKGALSIVGGIFEGAYMDMAAMRGIANIPPREVLLAQLVNLINSPLQGLVVALHGVAGKKQ